MNSERRSVIVGGGPAGMMLGYLLARSGIEATVLEREKDSTRAWRGGLLGPLALRAFREVGLSDHILALRHNKVERWELYYEGRRHSSRDLARLAPDFPFLLAIPLGDVLDLLAVKARPFLEFDLRAGAEVEELLEEGGEVAGVRFADEEGSHRLPARLVVGADGADSAVRRLAGIVPLREDGEWLEVVRARMASPPDWPEALGRTYVTPGASISWHIDREGQSQVALTLPRGVLGAGGLEEMREALAARLPAGPAEHLREHLRDASQVMRLEVQPRRARTWWRPGVILLGDAARTLAPFGGIGMGLALRDALVAANHLARAFRDGEPTSGVLARIEGERLPEVMAVERSQDRAARAIFHPSDPARFLLRYGGLRGSLEALLGLEPTAPDIPLELE